jgi:hypothetical protein
MGLFRKPHYDVGEALHALDLGELGQHRLWNIAERGLELSARKPDNDFVLSVNDSVDQLATSALTLSILDLANRVLSSPAPRLSA